jgi:hypothetical protein
MKRLQATTNITDSAIQPTTMWTSNSMELNAQSLVCQQAAQPELMNGHEPKRGANFLGFHSAIVVHMR